MASKPLDAVYAAAQARLNSELAYRAALTKARDAGHSFREIAEAAGVTRSAVYQILNRKEQQK